MRSRISSSRFWLSDFTKAVPPDAWHGEKFTAAATIPPQYCSAKNAGLGGAGLVARAAQDLAGQRIGGLAIGHHRGAINKDPGDSARITRGIFIGRHILDCGRIED